MTSARRFCHHILAVDPDLPQTSYPCAVCIQTHTHTHTHFAQWYSDCIGRKLTNPYFLSPPIAGFEPTISNHTWGKINMKELIYTSGKKWFRLWTQSLGLSSRGAQYIKTQDLFIYQARCCCTRNFMWKLLLGLLPHWTKIIGGYLWKKCLRECLDLIDGK